MKSYPMSKDDKKKLNCFAKYKTETISGIRNRQWFKENQWIPHTQKRGNNESRWNFRYIDSKKLGKNGKNDIEHKRYSWKLFKRKLRIFGVGYVPEFDDGDVRGSVTWSFITILCWHDRVWRYCNAIPFSYIWNFNNHIQLRKGEKVCYSYIQWEFESLSLFSHHIKCSPDF